MTAHIGALNYVVPENVKGSTSWALNVVCVHNFYGQTPLRDQHTLLTLYSQYLQYINKILYRAAVMYNIVLLLTMI